MNRRQFNLSLAAGAAAFSAPLGVTAAVAPQTASVPAGTYAWAQLIARTQNRCSPAMLMRHLRLSPDAATALFNEMIRDGVLRAPGAAGMARAVQPINATGAKAPTLRETVAKLRDRFVHEPQNDAVPPLVKSDEPSLGCAEHQTEDETDASTQEPVQTGPQTG
ncbi:MAG: hypothetical protein AB8B60_00220 [Sulfitobacter sp.]